jgi:hypothetical protein
LGNAALLVYVAQVLLIWQFVVCALPPGGAFPCGLRVTADLPSDAALIAQSLPRPLLDRPLSCSITPASGAARGIGSGVPLILFGEDPQSRCEPYAGRYRVEKSALLVNRTTPCPDNKAQVHSCLVLLCTFVFDVFLAAVWLTARLCLPLQGIHECDLGL